MQTPLEILIEWYNAESDKKIITNDFLTSTEVINKAKSLLPAERQIIINAYNDGSYYGSGMGDIDLLERTGTEYFNKTFKT